MSLAIALYNHHGIVMSADRLVNATVKGKGLHQSFTEQKLFLVDGKYGLSYTGTASINNIPTSALIKDYLSKNKFKNPTPETFLKNIALYFHSIQSEGENIIFIFCGYYNKAQFILTTNTINPEPKLSEKSSGILYSGENDFVALIVNSKIIAFDFIKFSIQDFCDFSRFLNITISKMMQFGQYVPTVGEDSDILAIYPNKSRWVERLMPH